MRLIYFYKRDGKKTIKHIKDTIIEINNGYSINMIIDKLKHTNKWPVPQQAVYFIIYKCDKFKNNLEFLTPLTKL